MHAHEKLLQEECGYKGTQPYVSTSRPFYLKKNILAGSATEMNPARPENLSTSEVVDPVTGFGGDGVGDDGCIADGPFAGYVNSLGPGYLIPDHCISRFINDEDSLAASQEYIDKCFEF